MQALSDSIEQQRQSEDKVTRVRGGKAYFLVFSRGIVFKQEGR